ncbi:hypothetical protein ACVWW6_001370 [Bradyrhizobium sp. USDA 3311]
MKETLPPVSFTGIYPTVSALIRSAVFLLSSYFDRKQSRPKT